MDAPPAPQPGQSGLAVECVCGAKLEVPTMRGLSMLEQVPEHTSGAAEAAPWGPRQGLMFLGGAIMAVGLGLIAFFAARLVWKSAKRGQKSANGTKELEAGIGA